MFKNRAKISRTAACQCEILHISAQLAKVMYGDIRPQLIVTLQNADIDLSGKGFRTAQDGISARQKLPHQRAGG